ncbi:UNVERIFIED_ORG: glutathione S-transferase [Zoogloea ramigera]|uniref:Glutathione S-transferase family protein n=1 Tax=Duganella zoogloeoides TaxID=75659 RepID=A0ABZ0XXI2_9BURK|nr:glutathione S-transferase family protein [Duganella zoogloeoides]WQH04465.1 glutathione S-transferase family protein [Duganella zoogloeoides]
MTINLTLHHCPNSRSTGVLALLEELKAPYELHVMNMKKKENREPAYLAINPMGKVPAIVHEGALVTEQVAIYTYLADVFSEAKLAPPLGDPLRGPYLRWMAFYGSCFEPALIDRWLKREVPDQATTGYGSFDDVFNTLLAQLAKGPYLLGEQFTALDVLWGTALGWMDMFELLPKRSEIGEYVKRVHSRPAIVAAQAKDQALAAAQEA